MARNRIAKKQRSLSINRLTSLMNLTSTTRKKMNKVTISKVSMFQTVVATLHENQTAVDSKPAFASALQSFETRLAELEQLLNEQTKDLKWITNEKASTREKAIDKVNVLVKMIRAYSESIGDENLEAKMNIRKKDYKVAGTVGMINSISFVINEAELIEAELITFGVDASLISEVIALRNKLISLNNAPRLALISRKTQTASIASLKRELLDDLRTTLDPFVEMLQDEFPYFYAKYTAARHTVKPGYKSSTKDQVPPEPDDGLSE